MHRAARHPNIFRAPNWILPLLAFGASYMSLAAPVAQTSPQTTAPAATTNRFSSSSNSVLVPFQYRRGHVMIPVGVAGTNAQNFILDSGYSMTMLPPGLADALQLRRAGRVTIVGIAGEEEAGVFDGPRLDFGSLCWTSRRVGAFPPNDSWRGRRREGVLGSGLFRRFVVILDQRAKTVELREPASFDYSGPGDILPLRFKRGSNTPIIAASLTAPNKSDVAGDFEVDTGCDSCLCLASDFAEKNHLIPEDSRASSRSGVGGGTRTRAGRLASLELGRFRVTEPSTEFFLEGSPAGAGLAGHIGLDALRNFRAILDYSRQRLILEPHPPKAN